MGKVAGSNVTFRKTSGDINIKFNWFKLYFSDNFHKYYFLLYKTLFIFFVFKDDHYVVL